MKRFKRGDYVVVTGNTDRRGEAWFKRGNHVFINLHKPIKTYQRDQISVLCAHTDNVFMAASWDSYK